MINHETEIGYEIQYQSEGRPNWFVLENPRYEHPVPSAMHSETGDLAEAVAIAGLVRDGMPYPIKPNRRTVGPVDAVRIIQRIHTGGTLLVMGEPHPDSKED